MKQALIVFAKVPRPGSVKTRLSPPLKYAEAAELYDAFLHDALEVYNQLDAEVRLYLVDGPDQTEEFPELEQFFHQRGSGLGEKMANAFEETFRDGYDRACIIGTDHPTLDPRIIRDAFTALSEHKLVIGPSQDGGYYLLGMRRLHRRLFEEMEYSHAKVFSDTLARATQEELTTRILTEWYDVDDVESLCLMIGHLQNNAAALPRTRQMIATLVELYPDILNIEKSA